MPHRTSRPPDLPSVWDGEDTLQAEDSSTSQEEGDGDFEPPTSEPITDLGHSGRQSPETIPDLDPSDLLEVPTMTRRRDRTGSRSGSMATVRLDRRAQLAKKLRGVFELSDINEVIAGNIS